MIRGVTCAGLMALLFLVGCPQTGGGGGGATRPGEGGSATRPDGRGDTPSMPNAPANGMTGTYSLFAGSQVGRGGGMGGSTGTLEICPNRSYVLLYGGETYSGVLVPFRPRDERNPDVSYWRLSNAPASSQYFFLPPQEGSMQMWTVGRSGNSLAAGTATRIGPPSRCGSVSPGEGESSGPDGNGGVPTPAPTETSEPVPLETTAPLPMETTQPLPMETTQPLPM